MDFRITEEQELMADLREPHNLPGPLHMHAVRKSVFRLSTFQLQFSEESASADGLSRRWLPKALLSPRKDRIWHDLPPQSNRRILQFPRTACI